MKLLGEALHDLVGMLKRSREIAEAAKMNGKVTFGLALGSVRSGERDRAAAPGVSRRAQLTRFGIAGDGLDAAEEHVALGPAIDLGPRASIRASASASIPGSALTTAPSKWTRGASTAASTPMPSSTRRRITWTIAERMRFEPALPSPAIELAVAQDHRRRHHRRQARPRLPEVKAERVQVLLAEHVVHVDSGARHHQARAGAVRAGHRRAASVGRPSR